jgi:hypothetical protein
MKSKRNRLLDRYRRHVQLYGPECILLAAAGDALTHTELRALEQFIQKQGHRTRPSGETVDSLASRIAAIRSECEVLNVRINRARLAGRSGEMERLVAERDKLRRQQESSGERLKIALALDGPPAGSRAHEREKAVLRRAA